MRCWETLSRIGEWALGALASIWVVAGLWVDEVRRP